MERVKVRNMLGRSGKSVPNQFIIYINGDEYFQSYNSIIVKIDKNGQHYLDKRFWDFSATTGKYRNDYLDETKKETEKNIADGTYKLVNLN